MSNENIIRYSYFLWFISADKRLDNTWKILIQDIDNDIYLNVVSLWEIIIKYNLGKLPLPEAPENYISRERKRHRIFNLVVDENSVIHLSKLQSIHNDPFDRLLICQASEFELIMMTADQKIKQYSVVDCL